MRKFILYGHGGSANHGCEAIVRTTLQTLHDNDVLLLSENPEEDISYGIGELCSIQKDRINRIPKNSLDFWKAYVELKLMKNYDLMDRLQYKDSFSKIGKGDIALSVGGDNYCYADVNKYVMLHQIAKERGAKTVLWGCSVEPEVVNRPAISDDLSKYDLITARETISYEALKSVNPNTILVSDTAFRLNMQPFALPDVFDQDVVGINISPMAISSESVPGIAEKNYEALVDYVLAETSYNVALIPHVVWKQNDDRAVLKKLYDKYQDKKRIHLLNDHNCMELKYAISKCRFFIGARTHATIAAYSTIVPTLVLGYSVKSRGIAKDLFGSSDNFVVPVQQLSRADEILEKFKYIEKNEQSIRERLSSCMEEYKNRSNIDLEMLL